jgi:multicomponent Na+:H+ antiporter subunit E
MVAKHQPGRSGRALSMMVRLAGFFCLWLAIAGAGGTADLAVGVAAAAVATWASFALLPPGQWRLRPVALSGFVLRFLRQSIVAGVDVALRALSLRLPLQPGFVIYRPRLAPGPSLDVFCTVTSLLPGTLPSGPDGSGRLVVHCLDTSQPVAEQLAAEEAKLANALGVTLRHE